jgi:RNA polymerase sigma factor for flagellar operon FliA
MRDAEKAATGTSGPSAPVVPTEGSAERRKREDNLVRTHLGLVSEAVSALARWAPRDVDRADLTAASLAGLAHTARAYDQSRGSFIRFAKSRVYGAVVDELRARGRAQRGARAKERLLDETSDRLAAQLKRRPSVDELALAMGIGEQQVDVMTDGRSGPALVNLSSLVEGGPKGAALPAPPAADEAILEKELRSYLVAAVHHLPSRMRRIVIGSFVQGLSTATIAAERGVGETGVSQLKAKAMVLLRDAINAQLDPDLVPERSSRSVNHDSYYAAVASFHGYHRRLHSGSGLLSSLGAAPTPEATGPVACPRPSSTRGPATRVVAL